MREVRRRRYDDGFRREALELIKAGAGKEHTTTTPSSPGMPGRVTSWEWIRASSTRTPAGGGKQREQERRGPTPTTQTLRDPDGYGQGLREIVDEPLESQGQQGRCTSK